MQRVQLTVLAALSAAAVCGVAAAQSSLEWIHDFSADSSTVIHDLSHDGGSAAGQQNFRGLTWTRGGGRVDYNEFLEGSFPIMEFTHVSPDGLTFGGEYDATARWSGTGAFLLRSNGQFQRFTFGAMHFDERRVKGLTNGGARMLIHHQDRVGSFIDDHRYGYYENFVRTAFLPVGGNPASSYGAVDMSADGLTVVYQGLVSLHESGYGEPNQYRAMIWRPDSGGEMLPILTNRPEESTSAEAVNADGSIVVGWSRVRIAPSVYSWHALKWIDGELHTLPGDIANGWEVPRFVNADGSVIASYQTIWIGDADPVTLRDYMSTHGVQLPDGDIRLTAMSGDASTFAFSIATGVSSNRGAFIVTIPAPASGLLVLAGVVCAARRRR